MVVPAYTIILNHLEKLASPSDLSSVYTESSSVQDAANAAFAKLNKYYNISSELCTIATVLDPRLKLNFYKADVGTSAEDPKEILSYVKSFYDRDYGVHEVTSKNTSSRKTLDIFQSIYKTPETSINRSEFDIYMSEAVVDNYPNFKVLDYWKINSDRFPNLSRMARDYLAVPGTSTQSERAFSGGRQLITDFRCSLSGETITACMLLKNWLRQWDNVIQPQLDHINQ